MQCPFYMYLHSGIQVSFLVVPFFTSHLITYVRILIEDLLCLILKNNMFNFVARMGNPKAALKLIIQKLQDVDKVCVCTRTCTDMCRLHVCVH